MTLASRSLVIVLASFALTACETRFQSSWSSGVGLTCARLAPADRASGGLVLEGDLAFASLEDAQRFYAERMRAEEGPPHPDTQLVVAARGWPHAIYPRSVRDDVTWCVSSEFGAERAVVEEAVGAAMARWTEVTGVVFRRLETARCEERGTDARVVVLARCLPIRVLAQAMLPYRDGLRGQELELNTCYVERERLFESADSLGRTALHEVGHLLGFVHAWNTEDYVGTCACNAGTAFEPISGYDADSIMGYPTCGARWGYYDAPSLSDQDQRDAVEVYCPRSRDPLRCEEP